jgi:tRNA threonylcarbamoyladenosine biosynthesis protein TsaB
MTRRHRLHAVGPPPNWRGEEEGLLLAIDTSTRVGGVALCRGRQVLGEDTWQAGGQQTAQVLPSAERLWKRAGCTPDDLRLVVVATGPGSFTGLRVGASLGKGLALALGIPLIGVPTLDALAYQQVAAGAVPPRLIAAVAAGRGQYYAGTYNVSRGQLRREGDFEVLSLDELRATARGARRGTLLCGEIEAEDVSEAGDHAQGDGAERAAPTGIARVASPAAGVRRAAFLAEVGRWLLASEGAKDAALLQPIYLRRSPGLGDQDHPGPRGEGRK